MHTAGMYSLQSSAIAIFQQTATFNSIKPPGKKWGWEPPPRAVQEAAVRLGLWVTRFDDDFDEVIGKRMESEKVDWPVLGLYYKLLSHEERNTSKYVFDASLDESRDDMNINTDFYTDDGYQDFDDYDNDDDDDEDMRDACETDKGFLFWDAIEKDLDKPGEYDSSDTQEMLSRFIGNKQ
jgi:hypothetical protein